jgi:hypothetical protein
MCVLYLLIVLISLPLCNQLDGRGSWESRKSGIEMEQLR